MAALLALCRAVLDPGDFRQTVEKLALYKLGDADAGQRPRMSPPSAPATVEAEVDEVLNIVAEARASEIGPMMRRIEGQGVSAVIAVHRRDPAFPHPADRRLRSRRTGAGRRPPAPAGVRPAPRPDRAAGRGLGPRAGWNRRWAMLIDTDLTLRSSSRAPDMAVMERALIRLAMLGRA